MAKVYTSIHDIVITTDGWEWLTVEFTYEILKLEMRDYSVQVLVSFEHYHPSIGWVRAGGTVLLDSVLRHGHQYIKRRARYRHRAGCYGQKEKKVKIIIEIKVGTGYGFADVAHNVKTAVVNACKAQTIRIRGDPPIPENLKRQMEHVECEITKVDPQNRLFEAKVCNYTSRPVYVYMKVRDPELKILVNETPFRETTLKTKYVFSRRCSTISTRIPIRTEGRAYGKKVVIYIPGGKYELVVEAWDDVKGKRCEAKKTAVLSGPPGKPHRAAYQKPAPKKQTQPRKPGVPVPRHGAVSAPARRGLPIVVFMDWPLLLSPDDLPLTAFIKFLNIGRDDETLNYALYMDGQEIASGSLVVPSHSKRREIAVAKVRPEDHGIHWLTLRVSNGYQEVKVSAIPSYLLGGTEPNVSLFVDNPVLAYRSYYHIRNLLTIVKAVNHEHEKAIVNVAGRSLVLPPAAMGGLRKRTLMIRFGLQPAPRTYHRPFRVRISSAGKVFKKDFAIPTTVF